MPAEFVFAHRWRIPATRSRAFAALAAVDDYPRWWRQIRAVRRTGPHTGTATVRSLLPYTLRLELTSEVEDAEAGVLRVGMAGDLVGWAQFDLCECDPVSDGPPTGGEPDDTGAAVAEYTQHVRVAEPLLRLGAPIAGPLLRLNHRLMMESGERGLARYVTRPGRPR